MTKNLHGKSTKIAQTKDNTTETDNPEDIEDFRNAFRGGTKRKRSNLTL